jgi:hypothetical protein
LNKAKNILICPLEWGLGHAARMIPVAAKLLEMHHNVIIASGEEHLSLFRTELPGIRCLQFSGFKPSYSAYFPPYISLLFKVPSLLWHIFSEHRRLKKIISENNIDIVISDNRFGLWNRKVVSAYVTHMPLIPFPEKMRFLEPAGVLLHRIIIKKYDFCFIPDLPGEVNLSGRLSHGVKVPKNVRFIGILSRFHSPKVPGSKIFRNTIILSGPQPQKEILKQKLLTILKSDDSANVLFEALPGNGTASRRIGKIICYNHLPCPEMQDIIEHSENIISRSGYTTLMDLVSLNCTATIIPTPGQTEQEYLAEYLSENGWFYSMSQNEINKDLLKRRSGKIFPGEALIQSKFLLETAINELLEKRHK